MDKYHALVIRESLENPEFINDFQIISQQTGNWTIYKLEVDENDLTESVTRLQGMLKNAKPWYIHIYDEFGTKLVIVYKKAVFKASSDKSSWSEATKYGLSLGIPAEQLGFYPYSFKTEEF